jgi:hypothetical protein
MNEVVATVTRLIHNADEKLVLNQEKKKKKKKKNKKRKPKADENFSTLQVTEDAGREVLSEGPPSLRKKEKRKRKLEQDDTDIAATSSVSSSDKKQKQNSTIKKIMHESAVDDLNSYPYEVLPDDHCETPLEAYQDISPLLSAFATSISKSPSNLSIYDPFFCEGSMVERLNSLGFQSVYNRKEDFYEVKKNLSRLPSFDLLLTNPPYSADHMDRLLHFCINEINVPFCLLLPNYVYMKDYYVKYSNSFSFTYIIPKNGKRYLYTTPKVTDSLCFLSRCSYYLFCSLCLLGKKTTKKC